MKTIILMLLTGLLISCKKDYTCTCETMTPNPVFISATTMQNVTQNHAKTECRKSIIPGRNCLIK